MSIEIPKPGQLWARKENSIMSTIVSPGQLWKCRERTAIYPVDSGISIRTLEVGEVFMTLRPGTVPGTFGKDGYYQILYGESVCEINCGLFTPNVLTRLR